jgi:hypothetical protein
LSAIGTPAQASALSVLATEANATSNKNAVITAIGPGSRMGRCWRCALRLRVLC